MSQAEPPSEDLIHRMKAGDVEARDLFYQLVYEELRLRAARYMRRQDSGHTLQATALVNEALLKICGRHGQTVTDSNHFVALASKAMRDVLVDHHRAKKNKPQSEADPVVPDSLAAEYDARSVDMIALDEALNRLAERDARMASLVELRFFGGMTMQEVADHLGTPLRSVEREWELARAWLRKEIR